METVTIKDRAKALNLSTSTVSRALRDSYEINPETKKLVLDYANKVNYRPNPIALSLKGSKSKAIGVIVPEIANDYFSQAINGIESVAYKRDYHVVIFQSLESYERELANIEHLVARKVDGLLISLSCQTDDVSHLKELHEKKFPIVMFDRVSDDIETFKVVADNHDGAFRATEHLINSGRKQIAHITSLPFLSITQERLAGYRTALEKYDIPYQKELVKYCGFGASEVNKTVGELLAQKIKPDAIMTASDRLALGCFAYLKKKNIRIPEDISMIGFTNLKVSDLLDPPLSSIFQPAFEIGQSAAGLLLDMIEIKQHKNLDFRTIKLKTEVYIRESSDVSLNQVS